MFATYYCIILNTTCTLYHTRTIVHAKLRFESFWKILKVVLLKRLNLHIPHKNILVLYYIYVLSADYST